MDDPDSPLFRKRSGWIILAVLFWAVICLGSTFYFSVFRHNDYKAKVRKIAWRQGRLPAMRGSIYSSNGTLLAYSKLEFFLFWKKVGRGDVKKEIEQLFGRTISYGTKISEKELSLLEPVFKKYPSAVWIENRERRIHLSDVDEIEEKFDSVLKGQDGIFVVMHDRFGRRVPGSLKIIREQIPGKTVVLSRKEESD